MSNRVVDFIYRAVLPFVLVSALSILYLLTDNLNRMTTDLKAQNVNSDEVYRLGYTETTDCSIITGSELRSYLSSEPDFIIEIVDRTNTVKVTPMNLYSDTSSDSSASSSYNYVVYLNTDGVEDSYCLDSLNGSTIMSAITDAQQYRVEYVHTTDGSVNTMICTTV